MMYKKFINAMYSLNIVFQAIFTLITPALLLFGISYLIVKTLNAPLWIYAISISVGVLIGLVSMIKFVIIATENLERLEKGQEKKRKNDNEK